MVNSIFGCEITDFHLKGSSFTVKLTSKIDWLPHLVQLDKDTIVDLAQSQELEGLADLGAHLIDTAQKR